MKGSYTDISLSLNSHDVMIPDVSISRKQCCNPQHAKHLKHASVHHSCGSG